MNAQQIPQDIPEKSSSTPAGDLAAILLTTRQAAHFLALEAQTLEVWRVKGKGPSFVKIGSLVRYERQELQAFVERNRRRSTADPGPGQE
jgi:hypothetical protein